jgi:hypothetical protein
VNILRTFWSQVFQCSDSGLWRRNVVRLETASVIAVANVIFRLWDCPERRRDNFGVELLKYSGERRLGELRQLAWRDDRE